MITERTIKNIRANWPEIATPQAVGLLLVQRVARLLHENAREAVQPFGMSFTEFEVLAALRASPPPHTLLPTDLYDAMLISSGGLTKVLKTLEDQKLIARPVGAGDKRQRPVALLAKGRKLAETICTAIVTNDKYALSSARISQADYRQITGLLLQMATALEDRSEDVV